MQELLKRYNLTSPLYISLYGLVVITAVYIFQYGFGYEPCELCLYQRMPWALVILLGALASLYTSQAKNILYLCSFLLALGTILAVFHAGVEYSFWKGLDSCSSTVSLSSGMDLLHSLENDTAPSCDRAVWTLFGISMAGYNAILSLDATIFAFLLAHLQIKK